MSKRNIKLPIKSKDTTKSYKWKKYKNIKIKPFVLKERTSNTLHGIVADWSIHYEDAIHWVVLYVIIGQFGEEYGDNLIGDERTINSKGYLGDRLRRYGFAGHTVMVVLLALVEHEDWGRNQDKLRIIKGISGSKIINLWETLSMRVTFSEIYAKLMERAFAVLTEIGIIR